RLRRLREAVQVLKAMWTQDRARFEGRYYRLRGAISEPKPLQRPHPPLWIGGGGEKVTLKLVAQHGDACNVNGDPAVMRHKLEVLRRHCDAVGRDYDSIVKSTNVTVFAGSPAEVDRLVRLRMRQTGQQEQAIRMRYSGSAEQVAERIREVVALGFDYVIFSVPNPADGGAIQRVAEEVVPLVA